MNALLLDYILNFFSYSLPCIGKYGDRYGFAESHARNMIKTIYKFFKAYTK